MTSKNVFTLLALLLFASTVFAVFACDPSMRDTQVIITPVSDDGTQIQISVLAFDPAVSTGGTDIRSVMQQITEDCAGEQTCIMQRGQEITAASEYELNLESLQNARITVEYYNMIAGDYTPISSCQNLHTTISGDATVPSAEGEVSVPYYYTECDLSSALSGQSGRTTLRVSYDPEPGALICPSYNLYYFNNVNVPAATALTQNLNNLMEGMIQSAGGTLPCLGVFLILGLLLSSLYFAGKSPISLLDITTPRLPQPKGVAAGGQILMPFGWTEMKRTTRAKMVAAAGAAAISARLLARGRGGDADLRRLRDRISGLRGTAADRAAGDVEQGKKMADALVTAGRSIGMKGSELDHLASNLPYHYGDAEQRTIAQILEALEKRGGRDALLGATMRDYFLGQRTYQSLETITGHHAPGERDTVHYAVTSRLTKAFGVNRYAVIGGFVPGMYDSIWRTTKVVGRGTKAAFTQAPELARGAARTTMEMIGGRRAIQDLEARSGSSAFAAWVTKKHPSEVVIGQAFPVNDKMAHLYRTLRDETYRDEMRYVLRQFYKKFGVNFNLSEHELAELGYKDLDILKRSGYKATAELLAAEQEMRRILSGSMTSQQKLQALTTFAEAHGAHIDHQMLAFSQKVASIDESAHAEHVKMILLQKELEEQNKVRMSVSTGGMIHDDAYQCHVGGDSLRQSHMWETMVLRTMVWDAENGHLQGGLKEELLSARLNVANRMASLDPTTAIGQLPEHMRNEAQLKAVTERNRKDLIQLFTDEGHALFQKVSNKSMQAASMNEIVQFMYGGETPKTCHIDKKTGKMIWWEGDTELSLPKGTTLVDVKRHWVDKLTAQDNFAIGQWVESRFTRSYVPPFKASIEAELDRAPGSANWGVKQRTAEAKKLWVLDQLQQDMEQRFNSQFGHNTYGTTRETMKFYSGVMAGFMEKALRDKGLSNNHPDVRFLEEMDIASPEHLRRLNGLMQTYGKEYHDTMAKPITYDDIAKSNKPVVMFHEGGLGYYKKNMALSDMDRVLGGEVALKDNTGQLRKFIPEDVPINFGGRDDLSREYGRVSRSKNPNDWTNFIENASKWAKEGGYNYEKEKVLAATLWSYANQTYDYERFWRNSAVSVQAQRQVTPAAPSPLRFFGADAPKFTTDVVKPFRDMGMHFGDYISKVALQAGGSLHTTAYDITPTSEYYKQHSWQLASKIMANKDMQNLTTEEQTAYRNVAMQHHAYHQVWDYAIDRNPWRQSTSFGTHQAWGSFFHFGPSQQYSVKHNLRAYLDRGEYASFMGMYGFPMDLAGKMMRPYTNMIRGLQMSMQGYASKWDSTPDALRQWNYTQPRILEAMQSINPFSFRWYPGKTSETISKLNKYGGSLEQHQLAGPEFSAGLKQAPQDIFLQRKGAYATARTDAVNPGTSFYNYRHEMQFDAPMAEYLLRTHDATYMYDKKVQEAAMNNTVRRTVSAEALAMRRDQELRGFGAMQNPLFGWANPIAFLWHMPVPLYPTSLTPRDIVSNYVRRAKHGGGGSYADGLTGVANDLAKGTSKLVQPHRIHMVVYCPKCSRSGYRGSRCACGQVLY
ncbi:hypothetical protein KKB44_00525 [Candidatus Micrarchaeota archaeon]|nr:hypothetical protein [Candidatus Micrarchaeota archaeon]